MLVPVSEKGGRNSPAACATLIPPIVSPIAAPVKRAAKINML